MADTNNADVIETGAPVVKAPKGAKKKAPKKVKPGASQEHDLRGNVVGSEANKAYVAEQAALTKRQTGAAVVKAPKKSIEKMLDAKGAEHAKIIEATNDARPVVKAQTGAVAKLTKAGRVQFESHTNGAAFSEERPGVVAIIIGELINATKEKPISKAQILAKLVKNFAERDSALMAKTVQMQVPCQAKTEKGLIVVCVRHEATGERLYYACPTATAEYHATNAKGEYAQPRVVDMNRQWPGAFGEALAKAKAKLAKKKD